MSDDEKTLDANPERRKFLKSAAATGVFATIPMAQSISKTTTRSWKDKPDAIDEKLISDGGTCDIVVVGGGTAGVLCARVAAMKGASVAVIENQTKEKYTWVGGEVGTVNCQYNLDHGAPRIDEEDFLREWARRNIIRHNPKRASYFVKNSGRILDWVIKDMSKEWLAENSHTMSCPPTPDVLLEVSGWKFYFGTIIFRRMTDSAPGFIQKSDPNPPGWRWKEVMRTHHEKAMADGAKWFFAHHAEICDVDGSGAVTGVVAKRSDGKYFRFRAKTGVALCAGDFARDREIVADVLDELRHTAEAYGDLNYVTPRPPSVSDPLVRDGSSLKLGIWAGGHIEIGPRSTLRSPEPGAGSWYLQLNSNGERFCDEGANTNIPIPRGGFVATIHDANWRRVLEMTPPRHGALDTAHTINYPTRIKQLADLKPGPAASGKATQGGAPVEGTTYCANTIEELLGYMNCYEGEPRKKALAEIARYNQLCEKGHDEDFGKDPRILKVTALNNPPFYGSVRRNDGKIGVSPGLCATTGLDTDEDGRVLNKDFRPIKGLYAAGNNAGNRFIVVYQTPLCGISLGMAMTEGYLLGERLAALVAKA